MCLLMMLSKIFLLNFQSITSTKSLMTVLQCDCHCFFFLFHFLASAACTAGGVVTVGGLKLCSKMNQKKQTKTNTSCLLSRNV